MYKCKCGREFESQSQLTGHTSHCVVCVGEEQYNYNHQLALQKQKLMVEACIQKRIDAKNEKLSKWISEQHTCERCGKVMTEYFGSGRFCSRACANARHHSDETSVKIQKSVNRYILKHESLNGITIRPKPEPKYCIICNKLLNSKNKTGYCSYCIRRYRSISPETRKKLSDNNKKLRELGTIKSWTPRNKISPNEQYWMKVLTANNIPYKHEAVVKKIDLGVQENGIYSLDFLIDDHIDLEIDSKIHKYADRKQHDKIRDSRLINAGYTIYRVKCYGSEYISNEDEVLKFLEWYKNTAE